MKKLLALLLALTLVVGLFAGCNSDEPDTTEPDTPATTEDTTPDADTDEADAPADEDIAEAQALFSNVNARKAVSMAFDKTYITDLILGNGSLPADFFVPVGLSSLNGEDFRDFAPDGWNSYDVAMAQEYWATALSELGIEEIEIELLTYDSEGSRKISEYIQGQLEANLPGLTVTLNPQPFENKLALAEEGKFELQFAGWGPDYPDPMTFLDMWVSGGGHNDAGYESEAYDALINAAKFDLVTDLETRWTTMQEAEELLIGEDAVLVPLYQRNGKIVQRDYIDGIVAHTFGGDYTYKRATTTQMTDGEAVIFLPDSSDIPSMNTSLATDAVSFQAAANVLEGLVMLGEGDVVEMGVAESYDVSEDGLTYTFNLRSDAVWSNGDPVTASDFVYAFKRLADPATGSQYNFMIETAGIKNGSAVIAGEASVDELGVSAPDDSTFVVELDLAVPYFITVMTFPSFYPINEAFAMEQGEAFGTSVDTTLYNGAFVLSKWEIGLEYEYAKNDMYWDAANTTVDRVNFRIVKDTNTAVNMYETGEIDRVGLDADNLPAYLDDPGLFNKEDTVLFYLVFNINNNDQY